MRDNRQWTIKKRIEHLKERNRNLNKLRSAAQYLNPDRLHECKDAILEGYQTTSIAKYLGTVREEPSISQYAYKSIGFYHRIPKVQFNASDYHWTPYFSDVGRGVAFGEKKYMFNRLGRYIRGCKENISRSNPNFETINTKVHKMLTDNIVPNTILCPRGMFVDFVTHFHPYLDWSNGNVATLKIEDCNLRTVWSNASIQLRSFIILDSSAATWRFMLDEETRREITVVIGESTDHKSVEYWVEALAYYKINNVKAFTRINLSK